MPIPRPFWLKYESSGYVHTCTSTPHTYDQLLYPNVHRLHLHRLSDWPLLASIGDYGIAVAENIKYISY